MSDIDALKLRINNVIDDWVAENGPNPKATSDESELVYDIDVEGLPVDDAPKRELPKDKRVARTKSTGDRVYYLDEKKMTRQWVTNPDVLKGLKFELDDVVEIDDNELLKYQMGPALYRVPDADA